MTRRRKTVALIGDINPAQFYRTSNAPALFDLGWQATKNKILSGELPRPFPLNENSRIEGWLGSQILEHRARMRALAEERAATRAARPKQQQPKALKKKTKKVKLHAPGRDTARGAA
jgi:hypothetical protein